jgi:cupin 2 domain-containing protein
MNLLHDLPEDLQEEIIETLIKTKDMTLERIVSKGHVTPKGQWYDQDQDEWVTILAGWAILSFAEEDDIRLNTGDHLIIPAHKKHRVVETDADRETIWLALHYTASLHKPSA